MQLLAYIILYPFLWLISILPFKVLYLFSDGLYVILYHLVGYRKKTVYENLKLVFPDKSKADRTRIAKKFYHHLCDMIFESIKSMTISEEQMMKRFTFSNINELKKIEEQNRSIILMCAHYASWEWIFILQKYIKHEGYAIYKRLANKYFDRLVKRIRARYNTYLITTKETIETLSKLKEDGKLFTAGFVSDQSPKANKAYHWQKFLGIMVPWHTGAEMIAKRLDVPVVFFKVKRLKRGYYETTFKTISMNPKEYKDYEITDLFANYVEQQVLEAPEYYLWTHKRWKHRDKVPKNILD